MKKLIILILITFVLVGCGKQKIDLRPMPAYMIDIIELEKKLKGRIKESEDKIERIYDYLEVVEWTEEIFCDGWEYKILTDDPIKKEWIELGCEDKNSGTYIIKGNLLRCQELKDLIDN